MERTPPVSGLNGIPRYECSIHLLPDATLLGGYARLSDPAEAGTLSYQILAASLFTARRRCAHFSETGSDVM